MPYRASLSDLTTYVLHAVKDHIKVIGEPQKCKLLRDFSKHQEKLTKYIPKDYLTRKKNC